MEKVIKRLLSFILVICVCLTSVMFYPDDRNVVYADVTTGGGVSPQPGGSGTNHIGISGVGLKFSLVKREDIVKYSAEITTDSPSAFRDDTTITGVTTDTHGSVVIMCNGGNGAGLDSNGWFVGSVTDFTGGTDYLVSQQQFSDLWNSSTDATGLMNILAAEAARTWWRSEWTFGHSDSQEYAFNWGTVFNGVNQLCNEGDAGVNQSDSHTLYKSDTRSSFYDGFASLVGDTQGITKEEWNSSGVLLVEPVFLVNVQKAVTEIISTQTIAPVGSVMVMSYADAINTNTSLISRVGVVLSAMATVQHKQGVADDVSRAISEERTVYNSGFGIYGLAWQGNPEVKGATNIVLMSELNTKGTVKTKATSTVVVGNDKDYTYKGGSLTSAISTPEDKIDGGKQKSSGTTTMNERLTGITSDIPDGYELVRYGRYRMIDMSTDGITGISQRYEGTVKTQNVTGYGMNFGKVYTLNYKGGSGESAMTAHSVTTIGQSVLRTMAWKANGTTLSPSRVADAKVSNVTQYNMPGEIGETVSSPKKIAGNLLLQALDLSLVKEAEDVEQNTSGGSAKKIDAKNEEDEDDYSFGVAVEEFMKIPEISSQISYAKLSYSLDNKGKLTHTFTSRTSTDEKSYSVLKDSNFHITKKEYYIAVVSNGTESARRYLLDGNRNNNKFWKAIKNKLASGKIYSNFITDAQGLLTNKADVKYCTSPMYVGLGVDQEKGKGYTVYVLEIEFPTEGGNGPGGIEVESQVKLQDYQLNSFTADVLQSIGAKITNNGTSVLSNRSATGTVGCLLNTRNTHNKYNGTKSSKYKINAGARGEQNGTTITADTDANNKLIMKNAYFFNGSGFTRQQVEAGQTLSTSTNIRYTYTFNLSRAVYGDARVVSALSRNSITNGDLYYVQGILKNKYGITPDDTAGAPVASPTRNSNAKILDAVKDTFVWSASWVNGGTSPKALTGRSHIKYVSKDEDGNSYKDIYGQKNNAQLLRCSYKTVVSSNAKPLKLNGVPVYKVTDKLKETIYKYSTVTMDTGKNSHNATTAGGTAINGASLNVDGVTSDTTFNTRDTSGLNATGATPSRVQREYRQAVVSNLTGTELKFYPEVRMRAYMTTGNTWNSGGTTPRTVLTMAELIRKVQPSSMYLLRLEQTNGNQAEGTVYSDTMGAGSMSGTLGSNTNDPVIYGGSDITLKVGGNYNLKLYGYALDLINYDKDKNGLKYSSTEILPYKSIINDESATYRDVYSSWGNDGTNSTDKLFQQYKDWVESVKSSLYADITLKVDQGASPAKTFNNFNISVGDVGGNNSYEEGVYNLYVRRGALDKTSAQYQALIKQIASDYALGDNATGYANAEKLFEQSGIYQTILDAIEDIKDDFNASQKVNTTESGAHAVRTEEQNDNWYDEEVKTFVVRRYYSDDVTTKNIVVTDKLDYNLTPNSTATNSGKQDYFSGYKAQWYLTLYFRDNISNTAGNHNANTNLYITEQNLYNPETGLAQEGQAYSTGGNVLINNLYISGADFQVPSSTTNNIVN